jgi:hypothetical protein
VLIISSQDCFRDAARELAECPEVAIIQHESGERFDILGLDTCSDSSFFCL